MRLEPLLREPLLRDDDEPLPLFELRERLLLAFDDDPDALLRAVVAVRFAADFVVERAVLPVFRAAVDPLLAAVFAVLPAVDPALRAVDRAPPDEPFDELRDERPPLLREPDERDDELELERDDDARDDELRDDDDPLRERDEPPDERDDDEPPRDRDEEPPLLRDDDERDEDDDRERDRDEEAFLRSFAGISALTTSLVSRGICFATKSYIRCSSRRIDLASLAVSVSPTCSASAMIAV